ncbi:unnamed protein product [Somion occarium]
MSESQDVQDELNRKSLFHRSRPSLTTNASGLTFNTVTTTEGLSRLSLFPPPPVGVPISPFEASLDFTANAGSSYLATPPDTPKAHTRMVDVVDVESPPSPHRADSISSAGTALSSSTGRPAFIGRRQLPSPPGSSPLLTPTYPTFSSVGAASQLPTPHDWHDGSSSIGLDGYADRMLSTQFLTELLTSDTQDHGEALPRYKRDPYEASVISDMFSAESVVTYPPRRVFPDSIPRTPQFPPHAPNSDISRSPTVLSGPSLLSVPSQSHENTAGRSTPTSDQAFQSDTGHSYTGSSDPSVIQNATYTQVGAVGVAVASTRSMSTTAPSLHSMNSTTPLVKQFPRRETIQEDDREDDYSPGPSTPGGRQKRERRQSAYSSKTSKSYVSSFVSRLSHSTGGERRSLKAAAQWFRKKPLPPVPRLPDLSLVQEVEHRKAEAALPLPDLLNRARTLQQMLDRGHRPYQSQSNISFSRGMGTESEATAGVENFYVGEVRNSGAVAAGFMHSAHGRRTRSQDLRQSQWGVPPDTPPSRSKGFVLSGKKKLWIIIGAVIAVAVIVIAVAVGVTVGKKKASGPVCTGNLTGAACSLDATCVCTSTIAGQCNQVAQSLVDLVPTLNAQFGADYTPASLATSIWQAQGAPGDDCSKQALLVDVAPGLNATTASNRAKWAQAALLWNLVQSGNLADVAQLQEFVVKAPWNSLGSSDGPTSDSSSRFTTTVSGFQFNFAGQTVTPPSVTFVDVGQPSQEQIGRTNGVSRAALDRMYTFASASSTQHQKALSNYWTAVLQQKPENLNSFLSLVSGSPILLPFDATSSPGTHPVSDLMTNTSTLPFPPPLSCYAGLASSQLQAINTFESTVFDLPSASSASQFDTSCFPNRPIYGILNVLRLRLPFADSRTSVAKQAAILSRDASSRAIVYSGEVLSALSGGSNSTNITSAVTDPRQFGTLNNLNHVVLKYLTSITDVNVAISLVKFVLSSSAVPPNSNSAVFSALSSLPAIEVAVLGTVLPLDIASTVSAFSTPSGSLFFGSDQSLSLRDWTINAVQSSIAWTERSSSPEVVRDNSFSDDTFRQVWQPAFNFLHFRNNANVNVGNITAAFQALQKFAP